MEKAFLSKATDVEDEDEVWRLALELVPSLEDPISDELTKAPAEEVLELKSNTIRL